MIRRADSSRKVDVVDLIKPALKAGTDGKKGAAYLGMVIKNLHGMVQTKWHRLLYRFEAGTWIKNKTIRTKLARDIKNLTGRIKDSLSLREISEMTHDLLKLEGICQVLKEKSNKKHQTAIEAMEKSLIEADQRLKKLAFETFPQPTRKTMDDLPPSKKKTKVEVSDSHLLLVQKRRKNIQRLEREKGKPLPPVHSIHDIDIVRGGRERLIKEPYIKIKDPQLVSSIKRRQAKKTSS